MPVEPDRGKALAGRHENAVRIVGEMRKTSALRRRDERRSSAACRDVTQVQAGTAAGARDFTLAVVRREGSLPRAKRIREPSRMSAKSWSSTAPVMNTIFEPSGEYAGYE